MRLLYWTETFWPLVGGVQNYAKQFIPAIQELGYEVTVVTVRLNDLPEEESVDGAAVFRLPFHEVLRGRDPGAFISLRKRVEAIRSDVQPDVVHVNLYGPSVAMLAETNRRAPLPTVVALHQKLTGIESFGGILKRLFDQASWITTVSAAALDDLTAAFPQLSENTSFIHNGIATDIFKPAPPIANTPRIVCIGRIVAGKGFDLAIESFAKLRAFVPDAHLAVVGDGPEKEALLAQVRGLGLSDYVSFVGEVGPDQVREFIKCSNAVVVPSRDHESFGLVAVEAALLERPVVASRLGGLAEIVVDGKTGFLVEQEDTAEFARRLEQILTQPQLATKLGTAARARALKKFSIGVNATAYDALYRRVLDAS